MAEGLFIRVTHLGASDGSLLISDVNDATDGPIHENSKAGAVYVPESGTSDLVYTADVARSFESGVIRSAISAGFASATFERGDSVGQTLSVVLADADVVAIGALGKLVGASIVTSGASDAGATMTIQNSDGDDMVTAADGAAVTGLGELTLEDEAADLSADDVLTCTWSDNGGGQGCTLQLTFAG